MIQIASRDKSAFFTDIHCHAIPGVDDGASDLEEALDMLQCAAAEGIGKIILTPHQKPDRHCISMEGLLKITDFLNQEAGNRLGITLLPGGEIFYRQTLTEELENGKLPTLAGSHYVLVEFYSQEQFSYIREGMYELLCAGYLPILAHVERYEQVCRVSARLEELLHMGCYYQMNAGSLTGGYGVTVTKLAWRLMKEEYIHFIATDAHCGNGRRVPRFKRCAALVERKCGRDYMHKLFFQNAEAIFRDETL